MSEEKGQSEAEKVRSHKDIGFNELIVPDVIHAIFILSVVACIAGGTFFIWQGTQLPFGGSQLFLVGILTICVGPFICRILAEVAIILFKIYALLEEMNAKMDSAGSTTPRKQSGPPPLG